MDFFKPFRRSVPTTVAAVERRSTTVSQADPNFLDVFGLGSLSQGIGTTVNVESALGVPAVFAAVNFIAGTMAGLPLNVFKRTDQGRERVSEGPLAALLHDAVNDGMSSFEWRKYTYEQVLTGGRGLTFIERSAAGQVTNLWPMDPTKVTIKRKDGIKTYELRDGSRAVKVYQASEVIDLPFMLKADGLSHRGPIMTAKDNIALAIAATSYGSRFFENGGVPPFAVTGKFQSSAALARAADDMAGAVKKAAKEKRLALVLPDGLEIKQIGADAEKSQLVELKQFLLGEIARVYSLPPVFLQDLTHGTFTNTEQQDLQLTKHTIKRHVEQFEQEVNLKLFGRSDRKLFVEMNMDGLLRGDFKTRMEGNAVAIQSGQMLPNEARRMENRPDDPAGNELMIQGATVPISQQLKSVSDDSQGALNGA